MMARKLIREATDALKAGRLHPDRWAEVDDLLLDGRPEEAEQLLAQHVTPAPAFSTVPGPRDAAAGDPKPSVPEFSPPDPLRAGEGRPAATTMPAQELGGGGRLNLHGRSHQCERLPRLGYCT
jgi:hypothetical protein